MIVLGLRFDRRDAQYLRHLEGRVRAGDITGQSANVFKQAAQAAETGEPLEVHCTAPIEAVEMAALYLRYGVRQPVIEELSGHAR